MAQGFFYADPVDPAAPVTPQSIERKRRMAEALAKDTAFSTAPVQSWSQGLARMLGGYVAGDEMRSADAKEAAGLKTGDAARNELLAALTGSPMDIRPQAQASAPIGGAPVQPVDRSQPRGIRNNNPGNIEDGGFARNLPGYVGSDGRFARFETPEAGIQAQSRLLDVYANKHGLNTVAGIVGRWAPATDGNNVSAYAANVAKQMGVDPTAPLNMSDPNVKAKLAMAMAAHENGRQAFSPETFARGVAGSPAAPSQPSAPPSQMATVNTRITGQQVPVNPDGTAADIFNPETGQPGVMAFSGPQGQAPAQGAINRAAPMPNAATAPGQPPVAPMPQAQGNAPVAPMPNAASSNNQRLMAALMGVANNPFLSDGQKSMAMMLAKDQMGPQYDFMNTPDGTILRTDKRRGTLQPIYQANKATYGVIGKDQFGREQYGWTDPSSRTVTPGQPQASPSQPVTVTGLDGNPVQVPPGMDPVEFQKTFSKRAAEDAAGPKSDDVTSLRKEVQNLPSYKNLAQAAPIYDAMRATAGTDSKASDLNLVYGLGKIMDPGSVVREGEMIMVKNTASLPDWLIGAANSLNGGQALTPETRAAILKEAHNRVTSYKGIYDKDVEQYTGIAKRRRMDPQDVIQNFGPFEPWSPPAKPPAPGTPVRVNSPDEAAKLPKGTRFIDPNGVERVVP